MEAAVVNYWGHKEKKKENKPICERLTNEERASTRRLIQDLRIDFDSRDFTNPSIQRFYAGLQALALDEKEPEPVVDSLEPDYERIKQFQEVIDEVKNTFFGGMDSD
jgi:hypothetical protein